MIKITKQQYDKRWDVLPINLREILCSPENGKIIFDVCKANHLTDEKAGKIAGLCGYVVMGFFHPEDLVKEIKDATGVHFEIAEIIVKEVDRKIFAPIKSDIDKVYAPAGALAEEKLAEEDELPSVEISEEHTIDLRQIVKQREEVKPLEIIKPKEGEEGKKEREIPRESAPVEGPVIIHKEAEIKPTLGIKKSLGGLFNFVGKKEEKPKPVEAQVELGEAPKAPVSARVVHYTEMRTPLTPLLPKTPSTPPTPPSQPIIKKEELKKEEEMIDLSTMRKINDQRPTTND